MKTTSLHELREGETLSMDRGDHGFYIVGPCTIIVIKEEAAAVTTAPTYDNSKWNDGSAWA
jgi:hypothetical protein